MKICNPRIFAFSALGLFLGVIFGYLVSDNLILTISIPIAIFALGVLFLITKRRKIFIVLLCIALGIAAFSIDFTLGSPKAEGNFDVTARIAKSGDRYYFADSITFDGVSYGGMIKINCDEKLSTGDCITFSSEVSALEFNLTDSYETWLFCRRVYYETDLKSVTVVGNSLTFSEKAMKRMTDPMYKFMDIDDVGIAKSLLFGDKSDLSTEDSDLIRGTGLSHIFALSGLHVGFFIMIFGYIAEKRHSPFIRYFVVTVSVLTLYGIITGFPSGMKRAIIGALCAMFAQILNGKRDGTNILSLACIIIVLTNPRELFDISFIMSVTAMLGIIMFQNKLSIRLAGKDKNGKARTGLRKHLADGVSLTVSANSLMFPLTCNVFNNVAVYALLANLIIIPVLEVTFVLLAVSAMLTLAFSGFGFLYYIVQFPIIGIRILCEFIYTLPSAVINSDGLGVSTIFYVLIIFVLSDYFFIDSKKKAALICALTVGGLLTFLFL